MPDMDMIVLGVDLSCIRNSNETRVARLLPVALRDFPDYAPDQLDVEDIYALTLNRLEPRYRQCGTIQISGRTPDEEILWEIGNAIRTVRENPTDGR
ncbi:MAG: late competence development ComFB family protein [Desulfovibrio sp.]